MNKVAKIVLAITVFGVILCAQPVRDAFAAQNNQAQLTAAKPKEGATMKFGLTGKMGTLPGKRDAVVAILLRDVHAMKTVGCHAYIVSTSPEHPDDVFITEVWQSREAHRASLQIPTVKAAIAEARPMLTGKFEFVELQVAGGLGVPK